MAEPDAELSEVLAQPCHEQRTAGLGDLFGVGRSTVYRAIERDTRREQQQPAVGSEGATRL